MSKATDITPNRLRCIIHNAIRTAKPREIKSVPMWAFVSQLTGHGCTISNEICRELGFDPNARLGK